MGPGVIPGQPWQKRSPSHNFLAKICLHKYEGAIHFVDQSLSTNKQKGVVLKGKPSQQLHTFFSNASSSCKVRKVNVDKLKDLIQIGDLLQNKRYWFISKLIEKKVPINL
jgi:hypothetical protein